MHLMVETLRIHHITNGRIGPFSMSYVSQGRAKLVKALSLTSIQSQCRTVLYLQNIFSINVVSIDTYQISHSLNVSTVPFLSSFHPAFLFFCCLLIFDGKFLA